MMAQCANESFCLGNNSLEDASVAKTEISFGETLMLSFEALIVMLGVIGNISVVIVISRLGMKKQPVDYYVQNLAIADLGILLIAFPLVIIRIEMPSNWPFGEFACLYFYPTVEIFYGASVWYIVVIAFERYQRMISMKILGQNSRNKTTFQRAKAIATGVWAISFLIFCLPLYFVVKHVHLPGGGTFCGPAKWTRYSAIGYMVCLILLTYLLPLVVISFTYVSISRVLKRSDDFIKTMKQVQPVPVSENNKLFLARHAKSIRLRQNNRAKKILTPLVVTFAVTMLPVNMFRVTSVVWPAFEEQEYYAYLVYTMILLTFINSAANPIIYSLVSKEFRRGIYSLFHQNLCQWPCKLAGILNSNSQ